MSKAQLENTNLVYFPSTNSGSVWIQTCLVTKDGDNRTEQSPSIWRFCPPTSLRSLFDSLIALNGDWGDLDLNMLLLSVHSKLKPKARTPLPLFSFFLFLYPQWWHYVITASSKPLRARHQEHKQPPFSIITHTNKHAHTSKFGSDHAEVTTHI